MNIGINNPFEEAERLLNGHRLIPAIEMLEQIRQMTKMQERRALATYKIAIIQWCKMGNGVGARREFLELTKDLDSNGYGQYPDLRFCHTGAIENAMLCALSFDEFELLAEQLRALSPKELILSGLCPRVREFREKGISWSEVLFRIAEPYYDRGDSSRDAGRYGEARSTFHLILANRRTMRLKREDWRQALVELCALSMRMSSDCLKARGGDRDINSPDEYLPIVSDAIPLLDEYLETNSGDETVAKYRKDIVNILHTLRQHWQQFTVIRKQMPEEHSPAQSAMNSFNDLEHFLKAIPPFTALALIDYESNDECMKILEGFIRIRERSLSILRSLKLPEEVCQHHSSARPYIIGSINEVHNKGKDRNILKNFMEVNKVNILNHRKERWNMWPGRIGKAAHLAVCSTSVIGAGILMTDVSLSNEFSEQLFSEYTLGSLAIDSTRIMYWTLSRKEPPRTILIGQALLDSDGVLKVQSDYSCFYGIPSIFGNIKIRLWKDGTPPGLYKTKKIKVKEIVALESNNPLDYQWSMQNQIYSFLYAASRKPNTMSITHCVCKSMASSST